MTHEEKEEKEGKDAYVAMFFSLILFAAAVLFS